MNNSTVTTTSCPGCNNRRNRDFFDTPLGWAPGPNSGPWRRAEPWGPAYPGPFGPGYWGGPGGQTPIIWPRPDRNRPDGPRPNPWEYRPYGPGFGSGNSGSRPYRY